MAKNKKYILILLTVFFSLSVYLYLTRPVKIGVILSPDTPLAIEENLAIRFYQQKFPKIGIRPVKLIIRTPALEEAKILKHYRELDKAGVSLILGGAISKSGKILAKESARAKIPTFGITTSTHFLNDKKDNFYRQPTSTLVRGENIGEHLNTQNYKKLAVFSSLYNRLYTSGYSQAVRTYFKGNSIDIPLPEKDDYLKQIEISKKFKPDVIFCVLPAASLIKFIKKVRLVHPNTPIVSVEWGLVMLPHYTGVPLENLTFSAHNITDSPKFTQLAREFKEKYNQPTSFASNYALSILDNIYQAIDEVGSSRKGLINYFDTPRVYETAFGNIFMNEFGDSFHEYIAFFKITNGEVVLRERIKLKQYPEL